MAAFASLVGERAIGQDKMQRILFGLCRMEALRVREQVGKSWVLVSVIKVPVRTAETATFVSMYET
jgi:hypothetical protein